MTTVAIGTTLYGSIGKWLQDGPDDLDFTLQPTKNTATVLLSEDLSRGQMPGLNLSRMTCWVFHILTGAGNVVSVSDADYDDVFLSVSYEGVDVTIDGETPSPDGTSASADDITDSLATLTVSGDSRGEGSVHSVLVMDTDLPYPKQFTLKFQTVLRHLRW